MENVLFKFKSLRCLFNIFFEHIIMFFLLFLVIFGNESQENCSGQDKNSIFQYDRPKFLVKMTKKNE